MDYARVEDGRVVEDELPQVGVLPDGRSVSGFDKLDHETLVSIGWFPVEDPSLPEYDSNTQMIERSFDVKSDRVVVVYNVVDIPVEQPTTASLQEQINALTALLVDKGTITHDDVESSQVLKLPDPVES